MSARINDIIDSYQGVPVDDSFMTNDPKFKNTSRIYLQRAIRESHESPILPFDFTNTPYGVILHQTNNHNLELAVMGFQIEGSTMKCVRLQGVEGKYRELSAVSWSVALLSTGIKIAKDSGSIDEVTLISPEDLPGYTHSNAERLEKRYKGTAKSLGLTWDEKERLFRKSL